MSKQISKNSSKNSSNKLKKWSYKDIFDKVWETKNQQKTDQNTINKKGQNKNQSHTNQNKKSSLKKPIASAGIIKKTKQKDLKKETKLPANKARSNKTNTKPLSIANPYKIANNKPSKKAGNIHPDTKNLNLKTTKLKNIKPKDVNNFVPDNYNKTEKNLEILLKEVNYYHYKANTPDLVFNLKHLVEAKADRNPFFLKIFVETELDRFLFENTKMIRKSYKNKETRQMLVKVVVGRGLGSKNFINNIPPLRYYTIEYLKRLSISYFYDEIGGICFWV